MSRRHTPWSMGWALIRLALKGYKEVPGYTVAEREKSGDVYVAMQLEPPRRK